MEDIAFHIWLGLALAIGIGGIAFKLVKRTRSAHRVHQPKFSGVSEPERVAALRREWGL